MLTKKIHLPDLSLNPNNVKVGDTVVKNNYIGIIIDSVDNNGNKVLQFWVKWAIVTATVPTPELASNLQKIEHIPHDLVGTTFSDGSFVQCFIYHSGEVKAEIIKDSGRPVLFSLEQLQSKLSQPQYSTVNIYTLTIDPNLQQRVKLNQDTVHDYSIALSEGEIFPPITVWRCEDGQLYLVDGFHRVEAAKLAKIDELPYIEKSGSYREAMLFTVSVNANHGLPRSNADKRKAVMTLLQDSEWSQLSTRELAHTANVSHQLVHKIRLEIADTERRQQNLQNIKDYWLDNTEELRTMNYELRTVNNDNLPAVNIYSNTKYAKDNINYIDNEKQSDKNDINRDRKEKDSIPDIISVDKHQYSLVCDRNTMESILKFMRAEGIESFCEAIRSLLNLYRLSKKSL